MITLTMAKKPTKKTSGKSRVKAHKRKTKKGTHVWVTEHDRQYKKKHKREAKALKGKRRGQTKSFAKSKAHYVKAGVIHTYDEARDRAIKSEHPRKKGDPKWRGDLPGRRV